MKLPHLQSLVVSQLPFFDHAALVALRTYGDGAVTGENTRPSYPLRLLIANQCTNTTQRSLADGLTAFPHLVFLDLSRTLGARDAVLLSKLGHMESLQILKLCGIQLRDDGLETMAKAIGTRVRSLDIRNNSLTDHSVRTLLHTCFRTSSVATDTNGTRLRDLSGAADDDWPSGILKPDPAVLDEFRDESFDERYLKRLTRGIVSRLPSEDQPHTGVTHLYIANNRLTVEGVSTLIKSTRLHVLDVGAVDPAEHYHHPSYSFSPLTSAFHRQHLELPGAEKLTPILAKYARQNLTSLRVDHSLVTKSLPLKEDAEPGVCELSSEPVHRELDDEVPGYKLSNDQAGRLGLPEYSVHLALSPAVGTTQEDEESLAPPGIKRGTTCITELVGVHEGAVEDVPILTATGLERTTQAVHGIESARSTSLAPPNEEAVPSSPPSPYLSQTIISKKLQDVRSSQASQPHGLLPSMVPGLRSLTLTDVPCYDDSGEIVKALIGFIRYCASEVELAELQIDLESKGLDPVRPLYNGQKPTRRAVADIFALRKITLEMSQINAFNLSHSQPGPRWRPQSSSSAFHTRSSTEDADSEAFWAAQEKDFSFFNDNEECDSPSVEPGSDFPTSTLSEKVMLPPNDLNPSTSPALHQPSTADTSKDVVQELAKFRKDRKTAYENALKQGKKTIEGYWPGEVKVVRRQGGTTADTVDYYGKYSGRGNVYVENAMHPESQP